MISMTTDRPLNVDFGWIWLIPDDNRKPGESNGHLRFFVECIHCDRWCENHQMKCASEQELVQLFQLYAKRLVDSLPFTMFPEDFVILASNTWNDPEYQAARAAKKKKSNPEDALLRAKSA